MSNENPIAKIAEHLGDAPVPPMVGVGAIALQMAMQYHGITTIQDGALYQALKADGKVIQELGLQHVFATARQIEIHLMGTSDRIGGIIVDTLQQGISADIEAKEIFDATLTRIREKDSATLDALFQYFIQYRETLEPASAALKALVEHLDDEDVSDEQTNFFLGDNKEIILEEILGVLSEHQKPD